MPIDIIPTGEVWQRANAGWALSAYHWSFLSRPQPMPETLIGGAPVYYLEYTLASWTKSRDLTPFAPEALAHYRALMQSPASVHAICEDYRAGASIDRAARRGRHGGGRRIACPTLVLYASNYLAGGPLEVWRAWCSDVQRRLGDLGPLPGRGESDRHAGRARPVPEGASVMSPSPHARQPHLALVRRGERVGVRGGQRLRRRRKVLPLTLAPSVEDMPGMAGRGNRWRHDPPRQDDAARQAAPASRWRWAAAARGARAHPDAGGVRRAGPQAPHHRRHLDRRPVRGGLCLGPLRPPHQGAHRGGAGPAPRPRPLSAVGPLRAGVQALERAAAQVLAARAHRAARPDAALQGGARLRPSRHPAQGGGDRLLRPGAGRDRPGRPQERDCRQHGAAGALHAGHARRPRADGRRPRQSAALRRAERRAPTSPLPSTSAAPRSAPASACSRPPWPR